MEHGSAIGTLPSVYDSSGYLVGSDDSDYNLGGWFYDTDYSDEVSSSDTVTSDITIYPQILEKDSIQYTVNIYRMDTGGAYPDTPTATVHPEAKEGQTTTYTPPSYAGFTLVTDSSVYTDFTATSDTVIDLQYERMSVTNPRIYVGAGTAALTGWTFTEGSPSYLTKSVIYYGETVTLPTVTLTGYTHSGWLVDDEAYASSTLSVTDVSSGSLEFPVVEAVLTINSYTLTLNTPYSTFSNGTTTLSLSVEYGTVISAAEDFEEPAEIDHYTFAGWLQGSSAFDVDASTMPAANLILTAQWTVDTYVLTFSGDSHVSISATSGGVAVSSGDTVEYGSVEFAVKFGTSYTYLSHTVTGSKDGTLTHTDRQNYALVITLTADTTVTFTSQISQYVVQYVVDGVYDSTLDQNCTQGQDVTPISYSKFGYTFDGWYSDSACTLSVTVIESISKNWILYGTTTPITYTVSFDANGGSGTMDPVEMTYGTAAALPSCTFTLDSAVFIGWSTEDTGGVEYTDGQTVSSIATDDITLYAVWLVLNSYVGEYDGEAHSATAEANNVTTYYSETELTADNYTTGSVDPLEYTAVGEYTVYFFAKDTLVAYPGVLTVSITGKDTVTYIIVENGGGSTTVTDVVEQTMGTAFPDYTVSANEGYSFLQWVEVTYTDGNISSTRHVTYSPTLDSEDTVAECTYMAFFVKGSGITFNANGGSGSMSAMTFSDRQGTLTANAYTYDGFVFVGWSDSATGEILYRDQTPMTQVNTLSVGTDNTLYAVWKPYAYTSDIIWTVDGYVISSNGAFLKTGTDDDVTYAILNGTTSATISATWLSLLDSSDAVTGLYVYLTNGTLRFDAGCVSTFADLGEDVTFTIKIVDSHTETFEVTDGESVSVLYNITAKYYVDDVKTYVHELGGTAVVTLNNTSGGSDVSYLGDDGLAQPTVDDDATTGTTITFSTTHFSLYEVGDDPVVEGESSDMVYGLAVIAVGLAAVAGAVTIIARRR